MFKTKQFVLHGNNFSVNLNAPSLDMFSMWHGGMATVVYLSLIVFVVVSKVLLPFLLAKSG
ncbi:hypothetical protein Ab1vBOLIVR2_gp11 [Agrobacterium phage OLIVR2]|uniref:Uncharacterized protein n=1 Tax=Agrobacterium phage OLIVR1 TaxID=2723769 RepID=A0A858MR01_9CAUD|nr:hypothetical protein KNU98_gp098 [Agrobacterium phage OLIVR1]QIW87206.1 hypothetical protein Ab1vBOLIVR1_gp11 [Agrobacterium phage OLIVR1]QIW87314.1 hypothetical protein Ab1vBOLIVR2_gp11 [Agrobacterium phage OLIVR2]QIW87421.1 hypothetical protein Ab1vBOLIVR3_gp11 [Agrobacterium phage OLIVR3]